MAKLVNHDVPEPPAYKPLAQKAFTRIPYPRQRKILPGGFSCGRLVADGKAGLGWVKATARSGEPPARAGLRGLLPLGNVDGHCTPWPHLSVRPPRVFMCVRLLIKARKLSNSNHTCKPTEMTP